jgi:hypothetical protein
MRQACILAASLCVSGAAAQEPARTIRSLVPEISGHSADAVSEGLTLSLTAMEPGTGRTRSLANDSRLKIGERVRVCFQADQTGYVSLWSYAATGRISRVLPNAMMSAGEEGDGLRVTSGQTYCVAGAGLEVDGQSASGPNWGFRVDGPPGNAEVYLHWSPTLAGQMQEDAYVDIDALARSLPRAASRSQGRWRAVTINYTVEN